MVSVFFGPTKETKEGPWSSDLFGEIVSIFLALLSSSISRHGTLWYGVDWRTATGAVSNVLVHQGIVHSAANDNQALC